MAMQQVMPTDRQGKIIKSDHLGALPLNGLINEV